MEPLRGGKLVDMLPEKAKKHIAQNERKYTPAEWAFRWLWNQPEVTCVLSGMNSMEMVQENCRTASDSTPGMFTEDDFKLIGEVKAMIQENIKVGCTACRYCMPCPQGVDIPCNFHYYILMYTEGKKNEARFEFARGMGVRREPGFATQCIGCGKCEKHCPQHLPIRAFLKEADAALRPLPYRIGIDVARRFITRG